MTKLWIGLQKRLLYACFCLYRFFCCALKRIQIYFYIGYESKGSFRESLNLVSTALPILKLRVIQSAVLTVHILFLEYCVQVIIRLSSEALNRSIVCHDLFAWYRIIILGASLELATKRNTVLRWMLRSYRIFLLRNEDMTF